ncbi:MAG: hypothetical protein DDT36_01499 [Firmicutes bacterium]|nr:hypothetical protein [Bacillota bacterium]
MVYKPELPHFLWSNVDSFLGYNCNEKLNDIARKNCFYGHVVASERAAAAWFAKEYSRKVANDVR